MLIKDDFSHKVIISASGKIQIELLLIIFENIFKITNNHNYDLKTSKIINVVDYLLIKDI